MNRHASSPLPTRRFVIATVMAALLAFPLASSAQAGITRKFTANSTIKLSPGVIYKVGTMKTTGGRPQSVRIASVDADHPAVRFRAALSNRKVVQREVVRSIALTQSQPWLKPMVATNGDMSMRNRVDAYAAPHSMAVSKGELMVAQSCVRPTLGIDADGDARIGNVRADVSLKPPGKNYTVRVHRVNTHRDDGLVVLFTKRFASSTRTSGGREVVLDLEGKLRPNGTQKARVVKVRNGGNTPLNWGQAVLSVKNPSQKWVYNLKVGQSFDLVTQVVRQVDKPCGGTLAAAGAWGEITEAQGGNYFTLKSGKIAAPSKQKYPSGVQRHPRTGLGITAEGRVLMVTVDGRRTASKGVTLGEMGQLMKSLGAVHAFNLDGGGSTVMARYAPGTGKFVVANKPSDGKQRPATQAFAVYQVTP